MLYVVIEYDIKGEVQWAWSFKLWHEAMAHMAKLCHYVPNGIAQLELTYL